MCQSKISNSEEKASILVFHIGYAIIYQFIASQSQIHFFLLLCENKSGSLNIFWYHLAWSFVNTGFWSISADRKDFAVQLQVALTAGSYITLGFFSTRCLQHPLLLRCLAPALHVNQQCPQARSFPRYSLLTWVPQVSHHPMNSFHWPPREWILCKFCWHGPTTTSLSSAGMTCSVQHGLD